jgi:diguanylate cyclase (GGDEF)-like protein/PAS domain S-box-containing protein
MAARAAADTEAAASSAERNAENVSVQAAAAAATAVAAAAAATADRAGRAAHVIEAESIQRAAEVAAAAVEALETVAAELPAGGDYAAAEVTAAAVAATVAAAAVAQIDATAAAASTVATAVSEAASVAALLAQAAARAVQRLGNVAAVSGAEVTQSSARTSAATAVVVGSTVRVEELAARLRVVTALRDSEHRFRVTFEHAAVGMMLIGLDREDLGRILRVNPALRTLSGRGEANLLALHVQDLLRAGQRAAEVHRLTALASGISGSYEAVSRWAHGDGRELWVQSRAHVVREDGTDTAYAVVQVEDITQQRRTDVARRAREARFRLAFDTAVDAMLFLTLEGRLQKANAALYGLLGYRERDLIGQDVTRLLNGEHGNAARDGLAALITGAATLYQAEHRLRHADGRTVWGLLTGSLEHDEHGHPVYLIVQVKDITSRKQAETELAHRALHDDLTGLPNRALLEDHLAQACARAARAGTHLAVLFLDIDNFKDINDSLGHLAGDRVLIEVATRLRGCLRVSDTAARLGGDEFVVVCEALTDAHEANVLAERIDRALAAPLTVSGSQLQVTASIGITTSSGADTPPAELLSGADTAMYRAKANGKDRYEIYEPAMSESTLRQLRVASELSSAVGRDELRLHYQPLYDLATDRIVGVEALLRWQHPTRGLLAPGDFLDVAEGRRLIIPIGDWVLATAAAQARRWRRTYGPHAPYMWVNVSAQQLGKNHFTATVERTLSDTGLPASTLGLEITERQLLDSSNGVRADLKALRSVGVGLALDDFGTGFGSLEYLRRFPFTELKIDRSFVSGLGQNRIDTAVIVSVIALAQSLDLGVVAEGVETHDQHFRLREMGCGQAQGYLLHRPAPPESIDQLLSQATSSEQPSPVPTGFNPSVSGMVEVGDAI